MTSYNIFLFAEEILSFNTAVRAKKIPTIKQLRAKSESEQHRIDVVEFLTLLCGLGQRSVERSSSMLKDVDTVNFHMSLRNLFKDIATNTDWLKSGVYDTYKLICNDILEHNAGQSYVWNLCLMRSGLEFLLSDLAPLTLPSKGDCSVLGDYIGTREMKLTLEAFDKALVAASTYVELSSNQIPDNIPKTHWWWPIAIQPAKPFERNEHGEMELTEANVVNTINEMEEIGRFVMGKHNYTCFQNTKGLSAYKDEIAKTVIECKPDTKPTGGALMGK